MSAYWQSAVNASICCLPLAWPLKLPCHATGCIPDCVDQWPSATPPHLFGPKLPARLSKRYRSVSSQFTLQHHTVKCQCNDFQWKTFTAWRVNWKKLSSETPLNSEVQIYQRFWGICCLHHQGSFTLVLNMEVTQSSEMLVIKYGILYQSFYQQ